MTTKTPRSSTVPERLRGLLGGMAGQFAKFGVVGAVGFVVDVGLFNLLSYVGTEPLLADRPLTAKVVSTILATVVAWLGNRYWTFRHTRRAEVGREFALYAVICVIGLGISLAVLWVSHYLLGFTSALADNVAANVIGLGAAMVFRFWASQRFVFVNVAESADSDVVDELMLVPAPRAAES